MQHGFGGAEADSQMLEFTLSKIDRPNYRKIRNTLNEIYFGKTRDIVNGLRSVEPLSDANKKQALQVGDSQDDPQPKRS